MDTKKTALLIINCLQGGGAERSVLTLGQGFYELGYEVHLLRFKPLVEYDLNPNLIYHLIPFKPYKLIPGNIVRHKLFAKKVDDYVIKNIGQPDIVLSNLERPDRVMTHSQLDNVLHVIRNTVSKEFKIPENASDSNPKIKDLKQIYGNHPCVCISKGVEEDLKRILGNSIKTTTIYNPFDKSLIKELAATPISESFYKNYKSNHNKTENIDLLQEILQSGKYSVHVGSFKYQKAHDVLLKAYAQTKQIYPLVLVGQGKLFNETVELAKSLGLENKVFFLGFQKNPYPFIKNARMMVLSSRFEGFGRVIAESLALGTPVISTDCPSGPRELLPLENLVPVDDVNALSAKIDSALENFSNIKVDLDDKFMPINIAREFIDFLEELKK